MPFTYNSIGYHQGSYSRSVNFPQTVYNDSRLSTWNKLTRWNTWEKTIGLDLRKSTWIDVIKKQQHAIMLISKSTLTSRYWMQRLEQQHSTSYLVVSSGQLKWILSRFEMGLKLITKTILLDNRLGKNQSNWSWFHITWSHDEYDKNKLEWICWWIFGNM